MLFLAQTQWSRALLHGSFAISKTNKYENKTNNSSYRSHRKYGFCHFKKPFKRQLQIASYVPMTRKSSDSLVKDIKSNNPAADVEASICSTDASWEADIIILAVPYAAEKEIAEKIKEVANQKIVISIANPLNETYDGLVTSPDTSAAEELQKLLPNSKVVKAFNTTFAADFSTPVIDGKQVDAFIAGNDEEALQTVSELVSYSRLQSNCCRRLICKQNIGKHAAFTYPA